ncbi:MAG: NAD-dependent deacetylase [Hespellia sp.]|nr:NAD-dependent deacetylase [Hespellia sp.]
MNEKNIARLLQESKYTVALGGFGMLIENGYPAVRDGDESYDIEEKYGYSTEEIFTSGFYATRTDLFFDFYRNEILSALKTPPQKGYKILAQLEEKGLIQTVITRRLFGLDKRAGCQHVIELHGSVYDNFCPHCGKKYSMEYIRDAKKIPRCTECSTPIRPGVTLFGEMVDNAVMTKAAEEIEKADVLLVLGTNLNKPLCKQLIDYYSGSKLILITKNKHFSDKYADYVYYSRVDQALEKLITKL